MKTIFISILISLLLLFFSMSGNAQSSVMSSGDWYKITVETDGIYRITYSELVSLGIKDPANVRIYGLGGGMLPELADKNSVNDLQEIPIWINSSDGVFKNGDYIIFYGQAPVVWKYDKNNKMFEHILHLWDNKTCYFIMSKPGGKRITTETPPATIFSQTVTSFDERIYYEKELITIQKSGRHWYGESFNHEEGYNRRFTFTIPDVVMGEAAWLNVSFMANINDTTSIAQLQTTCNGQQVANKSLPVNPHYNEATEINFNTSTFSPSSSNFSVELTLNRNGLNASGWLNYIRLFARRKLNMLSSQLFFRDTQSVGNGKTSQFQITSCNTNKHVWDITDIHNIKRMNTSLSGSVISFTAATDTLREFVAFDIVSDLLKPNFQNSRTENQNLHGIENVEMIIITHPNFIDAAKELAAMHRERDGITVETVTAQQVYNEFSSGMQDPAAIRNFMKHLYEKPSTVILKYLLLMGAGSYDNKSNKISENTNTNYIVTYQAENSWHKTDSYVSDDYFGIVGDGEAIKTGKLAIGVGRLPVLTAEQAKDVVAKIRRYMDASLSGDWPNMTGLLADDGDAYMHASQSDDIANYINDNYPQYTVEKMYLDAFPRIATADGHRYPDVERKLMELINDGCLIVNYMGHGNPTGLSGKRVINYTGIEQWRNKLYPLFVAATCEFGRYDDSVLSCAELMLLNSNGGSIATLASTRLVYSSLNFDFNKNFFIELLSRTSNDDHRLGDVVRRAKNASVASVNKLCFALLGDPALKLNVPANTVRTFSINDISVTQPLDTLKANSRITVKGCITAADGSLSDNFNGIVHITLFDKAHECKTVNNIGKDGPMIFYTQTSTLYRGKSTVKNGEFELSFIMPRNINYQYGFGKITYYANSDDGRAAAGSFTEITVGGSVPGFGSTEGPGIRLFMNDTLFRNGGMTDQNPKLIAYLHGETGINTSDEGIGHNITARLSNDPVTVYNLNRYYETELGFYNKGIVNYRFTNLPAGDYELLFMAWDLENNQSQASIKFRVINSSTLKIDKLYNYPNPFIETTRIYFEFNMPDTEIQVELQIFDLSGRLLRSMKQSLLTEGFTSGEFEWDRHDANGNLMNAGIYPYRIILTSEKGQTVWQSSKMAIGF